VREEYKALRQRIRDWARDHFHDFPVAPTGRIPPEVGDAYAKYGGNARKSKPGQQPTLDDADAA
jgi:hypothetical protein